MPGPNLLIGNGEVLAGSIQRDNGGGSTTTLPYSIQQARERLGPALRQIITNVKSLPEGAKPRGQATAVATIHPAFQAKTGMPAEVFHRAGLRAVGSKPAKVVPTNDHRKSAPKGEQPTVEVYLTGTVDDFLSLESLLLSGLTGKGVQREFCKLEAFRSLTAQERLLRLEGQEDSVDIEVVLHADGSDQVLLDTFERYAKSCGAHVHLAKHLAVPGLVFMPGDVPRAQLERFAQFTALRAIRRLPVLRLNRPVVRQKLTIRAPEIPTADALDPTLRVAVFDGGIGIKDFARWSTEIVPSALADTHGDYLSHGTEVTSALLFGAVREDATELPRPYFNIVHHRVLGHDDEADPDLYDCMKRIDAVLRVGNIDFANLSLGPRLAMDDGHPHAWTAMLDAHLAAGETLMTVAVGNDGDVQGPMGRIQPPADAVNALSVGAADSDEFMWGRAAYSCFGPGRSPGLVKPDGIAFGGTHSRPLVLLNPLSGGLSGVQGTSFAAPLVLRTAAAARALCKTSLSATALRALLIHRAERTDAHELVDVGWGRFPQAPEDLLTCEESEVRILYQGYISAGGTLRIGLPVPAVPLGVRLRITATFCFASSIDAADPVNYTRHGLTVVFRPRGAGSTDAFFSSSGGGTEQELRRDAHKWETVLHRTRSFGADELLDACFDVSHGVREHGHSVVNNDARALPYVLVATIASEKGEPIYQKVINKYRALTPIQLRQQIRLER